MSKHTPGPWFARGQYVYGPTEHGEHSICKVYSAADKDQPLILAAPEILKALKELKGLLSAHECAIRQDAGNTNYEVFLAKAIAAIAKAEGGSE